MIKKIMSRAGESIAETLIAMMIVVMALTILAGALSTSAKITDAAQDKLNSGAVDDPELQGAINATEPSHIHMKFKEPKADDDPDVQVTMHMAKRSDGTIEFCYYTKD